MSTRVPTLVPIASRASIALFLLLCAVTPSQAADDEWKQARKEFRAQMKAQDWRVRRDAFLPLVDHDGVDAVKEVLSVLGRETNAAVVLGGIETLGFFDSLDGRAELFRVARKGKGLERLYVLVALERQKGKEVDELLLEVAQGKDPAAAAQAALALGAGEEKRQEAVPILVTLLAHKDWQVRMAAARSLTAHPDESAVPALASALSLARGRDRNDLIAALEKTTGQSFGNDPDAWKKLAKGVDPGEIQAKPKLAPTAFGVPIYGQRVVIALDNSLRMGDPHPFKRERLQALCDPKDGDPIPWFRMSTNGHFAHGHVKHLLQGLPKGTKLDIVVFNTTVNPIFGQLTNVSSGMRKTVIETLDGLETDDGIASFDALDQSLDIAGAKESKAWKSGPDEILFITVNMPSAGDVKEADLVAAAIALKARLRMVPIHAVGIHFHPYDMCKEIAARTGGIYVSLVE